MKQATFVTLVREAFAHLDDWPFLRSHGLVTLVGGDSRGDDVGALRRRLLRGIDELRPPEGTPRERATWRRWRCLHMHHIDGATMKAIGHELGISERQARRDYWAGVDAVAAVLWYELMQRQQQSRRTNEEPLAESGTGAPNLQLTSGDIEVEAARMSDEAAAGPSDVAVELANALATAQTLAAARGVDCELSVDGEEYLVHLSAEILRHVLICLLTAGLQSPGAARLTVTVSRRMPSVAVEVAVQRTRAAGEADAEKQVGALLDAARRLVEGDGGIVSAEEVDTHVRRITLTLPAPTSATILVVDDNPHLARLFRRFLAGRNYQFVPARSPQSAIELAHELRPAAITLDVMMPTLDGWQLLAKLRADPELASVPVIVCSVLPEKELALSLGVDDFLAKPVTPEALLAVLDRVVRPPLDDPAFSPR